jgi:23S rRNA (guanosine2251-2'-O)-methyltransferase
MTDEKYLFGIHPVLEALESGKKPEKILFRSGSDNPQIHRIMDILQERQIPFQFIPGDKMNYLVKGNHQGVIAQLPVIEYADFEEMVESALKMRPDPVFVLLDGVSDVRNFGAIARSAECAGASGLILPAKGGAAVNSDAVRTSAGALLRIPAAKVTNLRLAIYYLKQSGFKIFAASEKTDSYIYKTDFSGPCAVIMGSEDKGISQQIIALADNQISIPMSGNISSLNVSAAAAVILFEILRQRIV